MTKIESNTRQVVPLVSICCLTYNHAEYIAQTLEGFLMQNTSFPFEIIIHDDASTDNTAEIIRHYADRFPGIIKPLLQTQNQRTIVKSGMNPRFNFPRSRGKYYAFCEGDDYWTDPLKLQKQVDFLEENNDFNLVFHNVRKLVDGKLTSEFSYNHDRKTEVELIDLLKGDYFETCSVVLRVNDALSRLSVEDSCDSTIFAACLEDGKKGKYLNEAMSVYRVHEGGVWSLLPKVNKMISGYKIYLYFLRAYPAKEYSSVIEHKLKSIAIEILVIQLRNFNIREFLMWFKESRKYKRIGGFRIFLRMLRKHIFNKRLLFQKSK